MNTIVNLLIATLLLFGSGYAAKELLFTVEKAAIKRLDKGLSKSESFAQKLTQKLTGDKARFLVCSNSH